MELRPLGNSQVCRRPVRLLPFDRPLQSSTSCRWFFAHLEIFLHLAPSSFNDRREPAEASVRVELEILRFFDYHLDADKADAPSATSPRLGPEPVPSVRLCTAKAVLRMRVEVEPSPMKEDREEREVESAVQPVDEGKSNFSTPPGDLGEAVGDDDVDKNRQGEATAKRRYNQKPAAALW